MGQILVFEQTTPVLDMDDDSLDPEFNREALHALMGRAPPARKPKSVITDTEAEG